MPGLASEAQVAVVEPSAVERSRPSAWRSLWFWLVAGGALVVLVGLIDDLTGTELSLSLFYLVPIAAGSWYAPRPAGWLLALASAVVWFVADSGSPRYSHPSIGLWNAAIRLGFFVITAQLLTALRATLEQVRVLSLRDPLTGAANARSFLAEVEREGERAGRYLRPFSLVYLDLDNFKSVNDSAGHAAGDEVLRTVVAVMRPSLRGNDVVARLGGDEFALLLPETGADAARAVVDKLRAELLAAMAARRLPVTFSIGVVTQQGSMAGAETLLRTADELMYEVKRADKNAVRYRIVGEGGPPG